MNFKDFTILCKRKLDEYYKGVEAEIAKGNIYYDGGKIDYVYYPTTMLCVESEGEMFSVELLGLTKVRTPLKIKKRSNISVRELTFIDRKNDAGEAMFKVSSKAIFSGLMFCDKDSSAFHDSQGNFFSKRFKTRIQIAGQVTHLIGFNDDTASCLVSECMVSYVSNNFYRLRYIHQLMIFNAKLNESDIDSDMNYFLTNDESQTFGVHYFPGELDLSWVKASYLMNLVLNDKIHETTIGDYLNDHSDIILKALGYKNIVYEPSLEWIEKTPDNPDVYINPDALLQRRDDFYDICDFKKALAKRKSLTKAERRRRRFVDDVNEGLAQLDNYEEYFTFALNAKHALDRFNVKVASPNKILIIGSIENAKQDEIEQSLRGRVNTLVVDYDSLVSSYIGVIK
ncbi:DUF4263 domain-containing protein [Klebsiella pneumoniae]|uniref:Shedu anti-phage system protein SduA domain-containing protein n=1 Tax=Klebsiella TaxID=570 RepID=UPI0009BBA63F|nr:Shedu anti-phage system protein SduA domain-containing protein [Klebsiella pneumoniae]ELA1589705.1 DUF4263 domain-containing protein [Klebsiella pneumoniae]SLN79570.1 Uncharacterised protein [Klebsiella pneumoniae]SLO14070.1 Uncharacterised protein [Klebsiella pneumoniae]